MISGIRLVVVGLVIIFATLILAPIQWGFKKFDFEIAQKIPKYWHKLVLKLVGVRVNVHGKFSDAHPLLLVCNHVSWVDILVMGSVRSLCFIAKAEISSWPVVNLMAKLQGTVFVDRNNRRDAANQADTIASRLLHGDVMVLFAEGTTSDGNKIIPFNSSLFGAAQYAVRQSHIDMTVVQPVAITYNRLHGLPLGRRFQPLASWPGNVGLAPHLIRFLKHAAFDVDVVLGEPLEFTATTNRKILSKAASNQVAAMFGDAKKSKFPQSITARVSTDV